MDEEMRKQEAAGQKEQESAKRELTCSVHFVNPKYSGTSSEEEVESVTCLVSNAEDLELERVFKRQSVNLATNGSLFEFGHNFEDVQNWLSIQQPPKTSLRTLLRYMIENHLKTTVQIEINKMFFNCHVIVLQAYSKFFMELQPIPLAVTLPEQKVSQKAFMIIYKWMLSDEPKLKRKHILSVFVAATYLRIEALLLHCWKYFEDVKCFNEESACIMYIETRNNPALDIVRNLMLTRIQQFLITFVATRDFLDIPLNHLIYLLSSDEICVNTEIEILYIIVRWLGHDWKQRKYSVSNIVGCIRFYLMPLWYLLSVRRAETHKLVGEVLNLPMVDAMINESISKITAKMYEEKMVDTNKDQVSVVKNAKQRRWMQDKECPYFHHIGCPYTCDIHFKQFESYLTMLQKKPRDYWKNVEFLDLNNPKKCHCMN